MFQHSYTHLLLCQDFFPMIGGAHTWMYEVYRRWPEPVIVLAGDRSVMDGPAQAQFDGAKHGSLKIRRLPMQIENISVLDSDCLKKYYRLVKAISRTGGGCPLVIHALRAFPEGIAALLYKKFRQPKARMVTYVHGEELNVAATSRQLAMFTRKVFRASDLIIANSHVTSERAKQFVGRNLPVEVIHPGVDSGGYHITEAQKNAQRSKWNCSSDDFVLASMARLEARKNHRRVLQAVSCLKARGMKLKYIIASDGEQKRDLEGLVTDLGLGGDVLFTGIISQEEKVLTYGACDLHVMPSVEVGPMVEGFGIVFLEAAAAGKPSIAGNTGGQMEAVLDEKTGLVIDGSQIDHIVSAIHAIADSPDLYQRMGRAASQWAVTHDWERVTARTWDLVSGIQGARG